MKVATMVCCWYGSPCLTNNGESQTSIWLDRSKATGGESSRVKLMKPRFLPIVPMTLTPVP